MYCYKCGNQIAQNDKFCAICGAKTENVVNVEIEKTKKELTDDIIKNELSQQKSGAFVYILSIILLAFFTFASLYLGGFYTVFSLITLSILLIETIQLIKNDKRSKQAKYYVLNRHCVKKTIKEDDGTREYRLWFANRSEDLIVAIEVTRDFYFTTKENELFYVVFLEKEKTPRLCYRKSEWTIKDISLCQ